MSIIRKASKGVLAPPLPDAGLSLVASAERIIDAADGVGQPSLFTSYYTDFLDDAAYLLDRWDLGGAPAQVMTIANGLDQAAVTFNDAVAQAAGDAVGDDALRATLGDLADVATAALLTMRLLGADPQEYLIEAQDRVALQLLAAEPDAGE